MPTAGNPKVQARVSREVFEQMLAAIERRNSFSFDSPWSISDFIEVAIVEKIAKMARGRREKAQRLSLRQEGIEDA